MVARSLGGEKGREEVWKMTANEHGEISFWHDENILELENMVLFAAL